MRLTNTNTTRVSTFSWFVFLTSLFCLFTGSSNLTAASVDNSVNTGVVRVARKTSPATDQYTNNPTTAQQAWFQTHMDRMITYGGYWDNKNSWYPGLLYIDSSDIYVGADNTLTSHPDWILHGKNGNPLYLSWGCSNGNCPQYAPNYANAGFRQDWINTAASYLKFGYKGLFIDDVNMQMNLSNGFNTEVPIDPATGQLMTEQNWEKYLSQFMTQVRQAFPNIEIVHNALWYSGNFSPANDPYVADEIKAADFFNMERGFADSGLTGDNGNWSVQNFMRFIDAVHALGRNVMPEEYGWDNQYSLAGYFLTTNGKDIIQYGDVTPVNWHADYDMNLGSATNQRYTWNGLIRRDFTNGMALLNPPGAKTITVQLPNQYKTVNGTVISSVTLNGKSGIVLTGYGMSVPAPTPTPTPVPPTGNPIVIPNGTYTMTNANSGFALDDPGFSTKSGQPLIGWGLNGGQNQHWKFVSVAEGVYTIQNSASGQFLTVPGYRGWGVIQQPKNYARSQEWTLVSSGSHYLIMNKDTGMFLAGPSHTPGDVIIVWNACGCNDQNWAVH